MKARYAGRCGVCGSRYAVGDPVDKWLGKWSHEPCKAARRAATASEGARTQLPDNADGLSRFESRRQYLRPQVGHTRGIRKVV
jgi:hypothetical protein